MDIRKNSHEKTAIPIYRKVAEDIRTRIISGELKAGQQLPSEAVLSASLGINHQTLRKSFKILSELHLIAQCPGKGTFVSMQKEERLKIGVLVGQSLEMLNGDIYLLRMIAGLSQAISHGYKGELILLDYDHVSKIMGKYNQSGCDGLVVLDNRAEALQQLCQPEFDNVPMVFLNADNRMLQEHGKYHVNEENGAVRLAMEKLYALGHRKIGFVCIERPQLLPLIEEYREFCRAMNLKEYLKLGSGLWFPTVRKMTVQLCTATDRPTAFVEPGFTFSYAAWQGLMDIGLKIPKDISFIGFDANKNSNPDMSSMMHPIAKTTEKAVSLLYEMRNNGKHLKQRLYEFPAEFEEHGSCRCICPHD